MEELKAPELIKPIPPIVVNESSVYGPLNLKDYIQSPNEASGTVRFYAELPDGEALPSGLVCTIDGLLGGIPASDTAGEYVAHIIAENNSDVPLVTEIAIIINPRPEAEDPSNLSTLKSKVWESLGQDLPIPDLSSVINRPISAAEVYYLLQRFAVLTIWDVYNLEPAGNKVLLELKNANPHYNIYDRGSCLVAAPKDLFSHERTIGDALQAAKILAHEVHQRGWTIEFAGFDKMIRAAWVELQILANKTGKEIEILHYTPTALDKNLYTIESNKESPSPE